MHKRLDRYYPFAEQMFFWVGDANTGVFNGSPNGYFAEYEHARTCEASILKPKLQC